MRVRPERGRVDDEWSVSVSGLLPGAQAVLRSTTRDGSLVAWVARARFVADRDGSLDTGRDAPVDGSYRGVDPTGLLWSMRPADGPASRTFAKRLPTPMTVTVALELDGTTVASASCVRHFGTGVVVRDAADGVVGRLFAPSGAGPHPGVVLLPGSGGGVLDHAAHLLAAHGYAVLSVAVFGVEDRPPALVDIDLEYLLDAVGWLRVQPETGPGRVGLVGMSRGGELALQVGALSDDVGAVVAGSAPHLRFAGVPEGYRDFTRPAWRRGGEPLPFVPGRFAVGGTVELLAALVRRRPMRQRELFVRLASDRTHAGPAAIEVERIGPPLLLVTGGDDQLWPSTRFAEQILVRRRAHGRTDDRHVDAPAAGHFLCFPSALPSLPPATAMSPPGPLRMDAGGTAAATAAAARDTWPVVLEYLSRNLFGPDRAGTPASTRPSSSRQAGRAE